ncbi:basic amino acid ABC transporter substrate-binding protein [uncultured Megasphaera sp.]|uniref:basic amino acid ABC transporter substrate-binding protein n=1 Tax=uncultured Megasphaera sp. TaxID=165188 RepID=UPI0026581156|nr:basic amino acid ABC transporter substrate-binding protein [uncultured Megasphaera sp.]
MMNKKCFSLIAASMAALTLVAGCGNDKSATDSGAAKEEKVLIVGTEPTFPPFEFTENDKDVGFDIDLVQAIGDKIGYKIEVKNLGFDALIPALKSGQIDLIAAGMDSTPERQKQVDFTDVYFRGGYTIVVRKDNTDISGYDGIAGKTVGAQVGSKAADFAREHGATVKEFDTNSQGWMELEAGTCDAVSIDSAVAMYYLKQGGDQKLKLVGDPITSRGVAMAISKDKPELRDKVNNALKELKADGTYAKLYKKWFGTEPKNQD